MQSNPDTTSNASDDLAPQEPDHASIASARTEAGGLWFGALVLIFVPQIIAIVALELPSALQTPLPADAEGNARVVHGGAALMLGFVLFLPTFPTVCGLLGCAFGPAGKRAETAITTLALCLVGLILPVVFVPALDTASPLQTLLIFWTVTNLLVLVPVQKRLLQASHTSVASPVDSRSQSSVS